jgi:hypothetical protein
VGTATKKTTKSKEYDKLTATVAPAPVEGRTKKVWRDSQECAHRWAANAHNEGRSGNVFFEDGVIYSYGHHFPVAAWQTRRDKKGKATGEPFVLLTTLTYSVTTSAHTNDVRRAIPGHVTVFHVFNPTAQTRGEHLRNLNGCKDEALAYCKKAETARGRKAEYEATAASIIEKANEYAEAVGLAERLTAPEGKGGLAKWAEAAREAERLANAAKANEEKKRLARERAKLVKVVAEWEQKLAAWQDGAKEEPGRCPDFQHPLYRLSFLRVKGNVLETSQRVAVPLKNALPILAMMRGGRNYLSSAEKPVSVDGFTLRTIDQDVKQVQIGCHTFTFEEIERAAQKAGL